MKTDDLLKLLQEKKNIELAQIEEAQHVAQIIGKSVIEVLEERGIIDSEDVTSIKADIYKMPYVSLLEKEVDTKVLNIVSKESAENYKIICFEKKDNKIKVGLVDPENLKAIEAVNFLAKDANLKVEFYLISEESFNKIFKQYQSFQQEISSALEVKAQEQELAQLDKDQDFEQVIKTAPVTKMVSVIFRHAVEGRASDIHIEPFQKESRVRYRIDGVLHTSLVLPRSIHSSIISRVKVLANLKLDETRLPQDGRITLAIDGKEIDFRVSVIPLVGDEKIVLRILDTTKGAPSLKDLGFQGRALKVIEDNIKKTNGMLLVTGPTGSGKSTTLFSILNRVNAEGVNISTLEDPVEYYIKGVNQSQVRPEIGFTFAGGLRALLRQDPDVIMVGEIRDNETAELAIHAGLTGHFVLTTLHTNSAIGAIPRFIDMKVEKFLLGSTLNVVVAQRLARKICPHCKIEEKLPQDILADVEKEVNEMPAKVRESELADFDLNKTVFHKGQGCARCNNSGYSGRIAIAEVIDINKNIKDIVTEEKRSLRMEDVRASQDFITMKQDGIIKVIQGKTTMEEVLRVIRD